MRTRSTSDEEKRGEQRSNEPIGGSPQNEVKRTQIEWTSLQQRRKNSENFFFSISLPCGTKARGEGGEKSWSTTKTLDNERYHIPTIKDFGTPKTEVTTRANEPVRKSPTRQDISTTKRGERGDKTSQQKLQQERTNRYGRVLLSKTSVPPNVVREEIRHLNRSYNKKRTNRYGRVLLGKTSVPPNVVREEIRHLNRSYNKKRTNRHGRVLFGKRHQYHQTW